MNVKASGGSPITKPQLYRTASISTIVQAEQQDRFLQLGELNELVTFLNSGIKRLEVADVLAKNANILVAKAADKIFVGGSAISYLERPQAAFLSKNDSVDVMNKKVVGDVQVNLFSGIQSAFNANEGTPPGFKPINVVRYGSNKMKKSLRDLDWFLRYLTYAIIAGDPNILVVNIRGLRDLIENACSSSAAIVALREMRKIALTITGQDNEAANLIRQYFNIIISEFEASSFTDKVRKRDSVDLQGLSLPQIYAKAGISVQKFVMKSQLSIDEKEMVVRACYRQVFERDISKAYNLSISDLESKVKNGQISVKEFVRSLGKSYLYKKDFFEPFVNSRVIELSFRHFLGRGLSSLKEFQKYFSVLSQRGLDGLVDSLINSKEYADYFGEETVPYLRSLGEEAQECRNWGPQIDLFNYSAPFKKIPQFITLFSDYVSSLPDQHPYGLGNDPLFIQFGAIFPQNKILMKNKSALFGKDTRRILIRQGPGIYNQISNPNARSKISNEAQIKIFQLGSISGSIKSSIKESSLNSIIRASYLRVFGRLVYEEELVLLNKIENQLKNGKISVRNFIRQLAKSSVFKSLYWQPFYVCKAIEYIHNRLLGRPTYGRQEINKYFDVSYKKGYESFIDSIIDSPEYIETFGNNVVPYERYITPLGLSSKILRPSIVKPISLIKFKNNFKDHSLIFRKLSKPSVYNINKKMYQGVTSRRDQNVIFKYKNQVSKSALEQILKAAYRQIFERDISFFSINANFISLDEAFLSKQINVRQLIERLGCSNLYIKEFYEPYVNTKVIELGTKHFLGRAPSNQAEIRLYNQILASQGLFAFIKFLLNSQEYNTLFGDNIVPYRRFPTLPAANFPNTDKLYNKFTKQNNTETITKFIN